MILKFNLIFKIFGHLTSKLPFSQVATDVTCRDIANVISNGGSTQILSKTTDRHEFL